MQDLYSLPEFRDNMNKLRQPVNEFAMNVRKPFREIEASSEPVRTSNYDRYLNLQRYEPEMQYDAYQCLLQLLAKVYPNING